MDIDRYLMPIVKEHLIPGKVNLIFGTRRVGKTFLLRRLVSEVSYSYIWLEGEDYDTHQVLAERTVAAYRRLIGEAELLIIDEAQAIPNIGQILKLFVDQLTHLRIVVTGSSAFDLLNLSGEPLTGRAFFHQLHPIAQSELTRYENPLQTRQQLEERLVLGSYPELFSLATSAQRERYLRELINTYLLKDIISFEGIRNSSKVKDLLRLVAFQIGKEVSLEELGRQLHLSKNTVEKYLDLFTKVFILVKVGGFSRNLRKEVTKSSRWYFLDNGVRNALLADLKPLSLRQDVGELWENYLIAERIKKNQAEQRWVDYFFWRTYDQQEIDWIEVENNQIRAYEFKWKADRIKPPKAFVDAYPKATFELINRENYLPFVT
ncbi:ATP-binding protein [Spirosoma sp. KNUC1025]|uniref:ATP-binding protein n=1 Tax=Spirosoma sp. KNUC1025 TaxID=2894082 RepID=UPI00386CF4F4|nr:ATP-binding protein [Spirosoma sp. KNUC1025]